MNSRPAQTLADSIAAAQAWWRDAGVDMVFGDEPVSWLAEKAPAKAVAAVPVRPVPPPEPTIPPIGGERSAWPDELAAFNQWWLAEPSLGQASSTPRVPPRGDHSASVMIIVPMPEAGDTDSLLAGPQGRLLGSFVKAMGLSPDLAYFASALPQHIDMPDWERLSSQGLGEIITHHVQLVNPGRLIVFGTGILPLVGHDPAQGTPAIGKFAIQGGSLPLLASYAPGRLLDHPLLRASLWRRWLEWTDGDTR
jgi:DNA polymerase